MTVKESLKEADEAIEAVKTAVTEFDRECVDFYKNVGNITRNVLEIQRRVKKMAGGLFMSDEGVV